MREKTEDWIINELVRRGTYQQDSSIMQTFARALSQMSLQCLTAFEAIVRGLHDSPQTPKNEPVTTEPVKVRVCRSDLDIGDSRYKKWVKVLTSVDRSKDNGYAFAGSWAPRRDFEATVGTVILSYGEEGSRKSHEPVASLFKVTSCGLEVIEEVEGRDWALDLRDVAAELIT